MINKRGQEMSITTVILLALGVILLVVLALGFTMGWSNLWAKINIFGGGGGSVSDVVTACRLAVTSQDSYTFCNQKWQNIKMADGSKKELGCISPEIDAILGSDKLTCTGNQADPLQAYTSACKAVVSGADVKDKVVGNCPTGFSPVTVGVTAPEGKICCKPSA